MRCDVDMSFSLRDQLREGAAAEDQVIRYSTRRDGLKIECDKAKTKRGKIEHWMDINERV